MKRNKMILIFIVICLVFSLPVYAAAASSFDWDTYVEDMINLEMNKSGTPIDPIYRTFEQVSTNGFDIGGNANNNTKVSYFSNRDGIEYITIKNTIKPIGVFTANTGRFAKDFEGDKRYVKFAIENLFNKMGVDLESIKSLILDDKLQKFALDGIPSAERWEIMSRAMQSDGIALASEPRDKRNDYTIYYINLNFDYSIYGAEPLADTKEISVFVNNEKLSFDQNPIMQNDRTLVPLRAIFEALGAGVEWEQSTQTVTAKKDNIIVTLQIGNNILVRNGEEIRLDVPSQIVGDRTLVPVRAVAESFGAEVGWEESTRTITITSSR